MKPQSPPAFNSLLKNCGGGHLLRAMRLAAGRLATLFNKL
jgi:hypothetical protein